MLMTFPFCEWLGKIRVWGEKGGCIQENQVKYLWNVTLEQRFFFLKIWQYNFLNNKTIWSILIMVVKLKQGSSYH